MFGPDNAFLTTILMLPRQLPINPMFGRGRTRLQLAYVGRCCGSGCSGHAASRDAFDNLRVRRQFDSISWSIAPTECGEWRTSPAGIRCAAMEAGRLPFRNHHCANFGSRLFSDRNHYQSVLGAICCGRSRRKTHGGFNFTAPGTSGSIEDSSFRSRRRTLDSRSDSPHHGKDKDRQKSADFIELVTDIEDRGVRLQHVNIASRPQGPARSRHCRRHCRWTARRYRRRNHRLSGYCRSP
jgi:hypothetical protein